MREPRQKERADEFASRHPMAASRDEVFVECMTVMEASETRAENSLGEPVFGPREPTFAERYPNLGKHVFITWPWGAEEDVWLEHMTGEPQGERRGS